MTVTYYEEHGDLDALAGQRIGVIGYGALGRPVALNLSDNGIAVMVGGRSEQTRALAEADGLQASTIAEVVQQCDILLLMLPDDVMPQFYLAQVSPYLRRGQMLVFGSGYTITFRFIEPPTFVDVGLIGPRILGTGVREMFENGEGFVSFVSIGQDATGQAWPRLLALAKAMGALKAGAIEVSFEREAELDLFVQQTVLPALHYLLTTAASLLLSRGYPPEAIFTELYLSGELAYYLKQVAAFGLLETLKQSPLVGQFGTFSRMDRFSDLKLERLMEVTLDEIRSGEFAREWSKEQTDGYRRLKSILKHQQAAEMWELEKQTLEMLGRPVDEGY